jgi:uncharacterized membrane protein (UPF0127 family)
VKVGVLRSADGLVTVARPAWWADGLWEETRGLLYRPPLPLGSALVIPTQGVHTWGMRYALDLIFLDRDMRILLVQEDWPPGRFGPFRRRARYVVELPAGAWRALSEKPKEPLRWDEAPDLPRSW